MRVAAVQMRCGPDREDNLERAEELVRAAATEGAELVVLPELFADLDRAAGLRAAAEPIDGPFSRWARGLATEAACALIPGSFVEQRADRRFNTTMLIDDEGNVVATYRKIHLFDVDLGDTVSRESDTFAAGEDLVTGEVHEVGVGLSICYDLRFPELFRILALDGARIVALPAAFTALTGRDHWEVLLRARAIENQVAVIAAAQCGPAANGIAMHGHAMIIDAWGRVLADAGAEGDAVVVADLDLDEIGEIRRRLPSLDNRRPTTYRWP